MAELRPLRGGCQCGRNRYIVAVPQDGIKEAQVLFNTEPLHQIPLATPLAAFIRVPLSWYHSTTFAFFPDETHSMIRRVYTHPSQDHSKRHFCGFCGTPLSYWSESPRTEADYINLTLGSLLREDLRDLEDMGLIPDEDDDDDNGDDDDDDDDDDDGGDDNKAKGAQGPFRRSSPRSSAPATPTRSVALRESFGVPWFDGLVEGTRLGNMRRAHGIKRLQDGNVSVEWEVVEYVSGGGAEPDADTPMADSATDPSGILANKRKVKDLET